MTPEERWKLQARISQLELENANLRRELAEAVAAEREACAVEADRHGGYYPIDVFPEPMPGKHGDTVDACSARAARHSADTIAAAIRARGTVPCPSRPGLGPSGTVRCGGEGSHDVD